MRKILVKAEQTLFKLPNEQWYVHSIFKHTFNITDKQNMPLILIASDQKKLLPGGVYLLGNDFYNLLAQIKMARKVYYQNQTIFIETENEKWQLVLANQYDVKLKITGIKTQRVKLFLDACQEINKQTGLDIPFHELLSKSRSPLRKQIIQLMNVDTAENAVKYL